MSLVSGFFGVMGADAVMSVPLQLPARLGLEAKAFRVLVVGDEVRDYEIAPGDLAWFPYSRAHDLENLHVYPMSARYLWPFRTEMGGRATFTKGTYFSDGRPWYEWHQLPRDPSPFSIAYAEVSTHNHFVLDRGGRVFNRTAPVIKLPQGAAEDDYLRLIGTLNSSTGGFWLKQNCFNKGEGGGARVEAGYAAMGSELWKNTYQFSGSVVKDLPLPRETDLMRVRHLEEVSRDLAKHEPFEAIRSGGVAALVSDLASESYAEVRALMIGEQEELDWEVYRAYGLIDDELFLPVGGAPGIALGERAFEIALARRVKAGEAETTWFERHSSTPITEPPARWSAEYRSLVERRLAVIESNPFIRLLEAPEYKRRWAGESWESKLLRALRDWLLDKLEDQSLWFTAQGTPQPLSVGEMAGHVEKDPEFITALDLWVGQKDAPVTPALEKLLADQVVPYLAAMRYKDSGLRKRAEWEHVWSLQRDEDAGLIKASDIPVPPKYTGADFIKQSYWSHRGKLDVPKERFIVYPGAGRVTDPTPLLGWAGWNHAQQGIALATDLCPTRSRRRRAVGVGAGGSGDC